MSVDPAYRPSRRRAGSGAQAPRRTPTAGERQREIDREAVRDRRRREQRYLERRRDLRTDALAGLAIALVALIVAPGLGVVALISIPVAMALVATVVAERRLRRRRRATAAPPRRSRARPER